MTTVINAGKQINVVSGQTSTGLSEVLEVINSVGVYNYLVQATVKGTGAVSATIDVECSLDGVSFVKYPATSISLTGTTTNSAFTTIGAPVRFVRFNVTAISGTGAAVYITLGS